MQDLPHIRLLPGRHKRIAQGYPWVYSNELVMDAAAKALEPGTLVRLDNAGGEAEGLAFFNKHTLIAARLVSRAIKAHLDQGFFAERLRKAEALRRRFYEKPFYRLVHAEADGLPGTIVDRYGDVLVVQINTAGMERAKEPFLAALAEVTGASTILLRSDGSARQQEGLQPEERLVQGTLPELVSVEENGATYFADLGGGQKTGWFYDQRDNRAWIRTFAKGARVLEGYCYSGGFTMQAALAGASEVTAVDRSESALDLARKAAEANGVADRVKLQKAEVFADFARRKDERYDLVLVDPPAFIKSKRDLNQGLKGYRKLARLAAQVVAPGGVLFIASCSFHADLGSFLQAVAGGLMDAGRQGRILKASGAAPDHPVHPQLPETSYLKALTLAVD
jgi:23S rRNA (cytosine1962-C5)-methyltransferase